MNYLKLFNSFIVNITEVKLEPYTKDEDVPDKATIVALDKGELVKVSGTSFNLLSNFELRTNEMVYDNVQITESEKDKLKQESYLILIQRSSFTLNNMILESNYSSLMTSNNFFYCVYIQNRLVTLQNIETSISGFHLTSIDPLNLHIENITVDYYKSLGGFYIYPVCNYPEAALDTYTYTKNVTVYYSQERKAIPVSRSFLHYVSSGDLIIDGIISLTFLYGNEQTPFIQFSSFSDCMPDIDTVKYVNLTGLQLALAYRNSVSYNSVVCLLNEELYRQIQVSVSNSYVYEHFNSIFPPIYLIGNMMSNLIISDATYSN